MADADKKDEIGLVKLSNAIKNIFGDRFTDDYIMYWLLLIDINANGIIDRTEYELSTATEDSDLTDFRSKCKLYIYIHSYTQ